MPLLTASPRVLSTQFSSCTFLGGTLGRVQYMLNHQAYLNAFCLREKIGFLWEWIFELQYPSIQRAAIQSYKYRNSVVLGFPSIEWDLTMRLRYRVWGMRWIGPQAINLLCSIGPPFHFRCIRFRVNLCNEFFENSHSLRKGKPDCSTSTQKASCKEGKISV